MKRWEYMQILTAEGMKDQEIDNHGDRGWELVTVALFKNGVLYIFKREKAT